MRKGFQRAYGDDDADLSHELGEALRFVPVPEISQDFDARIHAAMEARDPWWVAIWQRAWPVLSTAVCSLLVVLALLDAVGGKTGHPAGSHSLAAGPTREDQGAADSTDVSMHGFLSFRRAPVARRGATEGNP